MSTDEERRMYIKQQRKNKQGPAERNLGDRSFIDKEGNIVKPNKADYQEAIKRRDEYNSSVRDEYQRSKRKYVFPIIIIGILGGLFFLSSNMTGKVVGLSQNYSNGIGASLMIIGLIGTFFLMKKR